MNLEKNKIIINEVLEKLEKEKDYCLSEKPLYNIGRFGFSIVTLQSCFGTIYIYNLSKVLSYNLNIAPFLGMFTVLSGIGVTCFGLKVRDINYKINYLNYELEKYNNKLKLCDSNYYLNAKNNTNIVSIDELKIISSRINLIEMIYSDKYRFKYYRKNGNLNDIISSIYESTYKEKINSDELNYQINITNNYLDGKYSKKKVKK